VLVSGNKAWHQRNTSQNIAHPADVKTGLVAAARRVIQHRDSIALHNRVWRDIDRLKGAEKYQGQLHVTLFVGPLSSGTHRALKEQLRSGIPHQALAADVHITPWVKVFRWVGIIRIWSNNTHTILP